MNPDSTPRSAPPPPVVPATAPPGDQTTAGAQPRKALPLAETESDLAAEFLRWG